MRIIYQVDSLRLIHPTRNYNHISQIEHGQTIHVQDIQGYGLSVPSRMLLKVTLMPTSPVDPVQNTAQNRSRRESCVRSVMKKHTGVGFA
ncbi:MAG: hypothetical protein HUU08_16055 [Candidatus Brocadia sp.]|nr:hypothetical protein [Candidatus Brocadia sp.]UJS17332.1 MAG: hypothetical protein L3J17_15690 [Candidatus Jettenia sp.]